MIKDPVYWLIAMLGLLLIIAALMWRDRNNYICSVCGKTHKLIKGSQEQDAWCDECGCVTRMVKE